MSDNENKSDAVASPVRRRVLSALAVTGGGGALASSLPERWSRPVVDTVLLPAHAQTTLGDGCPGISCHVDFVDGFEFEESIDGPATRSISLGVSSSVEDAWTLAGLSATLCEAVADVTVTLSIAGFSVGDPTCTLDDYAGPLDAQTDGSGTATFADLTGGTLEPGCQWVLTFSAPGYGSCEITLNFTA